MSSHLLHFSGDPIVKEAVDSQLQRESGWTRKSSTALECEKILQNVKQTSFFPTPDNCYNYKASKRLEMPKIKKAAKTLVSEKFQNEAYSKASQMEVQGALANLLAEEKFNIKWKSVIFSVPRRVMAWAARAATNSLASPDNLARWQDGGKLNTQSVPCAQLLHIHSDIFLVTARKHFQYRNNIINYMYELFSSQWMDGVKLYADLDGCRVNGVTIPSDITLTGQKPGLVIINRAASPPDVRLIELTVPWDTAGNIKKAFDRKTDRYHKLCKDIKQQGFKCFNMPLEVGVRGFIDKRNKGLLSHLCNIMEIRKVSEVTRKCSELALLGSITIWNAPHSSDWTSGGF